jgi:hypothetical protein
MSQPHIISMLLRDPGTPADREAHARLAAALPTQNSSLNAK